MQNVSLGEPSTVAARSTAFLLCLVHAVYAQPRDDDISPYVFTCNAKFTMDETWYLVPTGERFLNHLHNNADIRIGPIEEENLVFPLNYGEFGFSQYTVTAPRNNLS